MIPGILIGLVVGFLLAALVFGLFATSSHAELEADKWRLEQENWRLQAELARRAGVA